MRKENKIKVKKVKLDKPFNDNKKRSKTPRPQTKLQITKSDD